VVMFLQTGTVDRPDILLAVPGFIGTLGLAVFSLVGYGRLNNKSWKDLLLFIAVILLVFLFFIAIFAAFTPQYLGMFRWIVGG